MPQPVITPILSLFSSVMDRPLSCQAISAAATAYWTKWSTFFACFFSNHDSTSNPFTSAAICEA